MYRSVVKCNLYMLSLHVCRLAQAMHHLGGAVAVQPTAVAGVGLINICKSRALSASPRTDN